MLQSVTGEYEAYLAGHTLFNLLAANASFRLPVLLKTRVNINKWNLHTYYEFSKIVWKAESAGDAELLMAEASGQVGSMDLLRHSHMQRVSFLKKPGGIKEKDMQD